MVRVLFMSKENTYPKFYFGKSALTSIVIFHENLKAINYHDEIVLNNLENYIATKNKSDSMKAILKGDKEGLREAFAEHLRKCREEDNETSSHPSDIVFNIAEWAWLIKSNITAQDIIDIVMDIFDETLVQNFYYNKMFGLFTTIKPELNYLDLLLRVKYNLSKYGIEY